MKFKGLSFFLFFLVVMQGYCFAQIVDPLSFFPHHQGDSWEYLVLEDFVGVVDTLQFVTINDSLGNDGLHYVKRSRKIFNGGQSVFEDNFVVDTSSYEVFGPAEEMAFYGLIYKLDAELGDRWIAKGSDSLGRAVIAEVVDEYQGELFGKLVNVKAIAYVDSINEFVFIGMHTIASGFGLIRVDYEFATPGLFINGVIIDSVRYGHLTGIPSNRKPEINSFNSFELHQNYPNPFNPITTISYLLNRTLHVKLTVFNVAGERVAFLVNEQQHPGSHRFIFDGINLPSGIYIYQLKAGNYVNSRKMTLIK